MPIITLTTDYGLLDPYAGQLKGSLLCACPSAQLVDITHEISPFDIIGAAYFMSHACEHFPQGTIHICTVDLIADRDPTYICFQNKGQTYILPDNGLAYLLWPTLDVTFIKVPHVEGHSNKRSIAAATAKLTLGFDPIHIGELHNNPEQSIRPRPVTTPDYIRGSIIHIDRYHNAIINVHRSLVERMSKGRIIHTRFSNSEPIVGIVNHYHEVPQGDLLARYNSLGFVELAINMGRACQLFGLQKDQLVQLDFLG